MKKILICAIMLSSIIGTGTALSYANSKEDAPKQEVIRALKVTGNRVIFRSGPGKNYSQLRDYDGTPIYLNKGDILMYGRKGVRNGYRNVYIPNGFDKDGWVAVQYLKETRWDDGIVY